MSTNAGLKWVMKSVYFNQFNIVFYYQMLTHSLVITTKRKFKKKNKIVKSYDLNSSTQKFCQSGFRFEW